MKKVISILIVAALLMSLMVSVFATDAEVPTLTVGSATAEVGDEVTLEVTISETKYAAYGLQILYDAEALELIAVEPGDEAFDNFLANTDTGKVTDFRARDKKVEGQLFTMTFKVLAAGEHTVELEIDSFNMADQSEVEVVAVAGTISVAGAEVPDVENPLVDGDNVIELPRGATEASVYNYVATQTGTLYIAAVDFKYAASWTEGYEDNNDYMDDWTNNTVFTVNGEELEGGFYGSVEVVAGEIYTFSWSLKEGATYGFQATINLSYTDELIPVVGIDFALKPSDLPRNTVEIAAGDKVLYKLSYEFSGYILTVTGENAYIYYEFTDWWSGETVQTRIDAVDGVVEYDLDKHTCVEIYIGNDGSEATTFALDYYAPVGGANNPIVVETLDEIELTILAQNEGYTYFKWTATEVGTIWVTPGSIYVNFENLTSGEYGDYDDTWENYYVYVEEGDELLIAIGGWLEEDTFYDFPYEFVAGYREGSEQNPFEIDLLQPLDVNLYEETVYYSWTPAEDMTVTLNFTLKYTWSSNLPTITINGEAYTLGDELTVTAGEPVIMCLSTVPSVYGTLQAVEVEPPIVVENPIVIGDNEIEIVKGATEASEYNFVATETGTLYIAVTEYQYSASWTGGAYDDEYDMYDFENYTIFTVNGEALSGVYFGSIEVVAGEVYTFSWAHNEDSSYGFRGTLNLSWTAENIPVPGVDMALRPADLPMNTVEIPAGGSQLYLLSYEFDGYILTVTGENAYIYYEVEDWWTGEVTQTRIDAVDGVVEFDFTKHAVTQIYIGNDGAEATTFGLDYYAPEGGMHNPIIVESLDDVETTIMPQAEGYAYFKWTATEVGTVWITPGNFYVNFENLTSDEYGSYDDAWENYYIYVEEGDELLIAIGGWVEEETFYDFPYWFVPGYREGSEQNPFEIDLLEPLALNLYNETVYYSWTPAEDMTVTINFTLKYSWSSNVPTMIINGEAFEFGVTALDGTEIAVSAELTVTAGEPVIMVLSTEPSVYGTLQAIKVEGEEPAPEVIYEGEITVETTDTYAWSDEYVLTAPVTGTYTFYIPAGLSVWSFEAYNNNQDPEIDFNLQPDGGTVVVDLTEGDEYGFYMMAATKGEWTITYTVVASEGDQGGDEPIEDNYTYLDLTIGYNNIEGADIHWIYTAPEAGTLILNAGFCMGEVTVTVKVNDGEAQTLAAVSQLTLELQAGDVVKINALTAGGYMTITAEWETEGGETECEHEYVDGVCIHCGEEDPNYVAPSEPDGTSGNPFIVEELPFTAEQETADDLYYKWTATENGTLYIYYTDGMCTLSGSSVGSWEYADGGKYIKVAAGDVITINYWSGTGFTLEFVADSGEAEPGTEANPIAIESLNITLTIDDDGIYYAWTATEAGDVVIRIAETTWSYGYGLTINGETLFGAGSEMTITVAEGDQIIIMIEVYPSATSDGQLVLEQVVETPECEHEYVDGVCTKCGEADPDYNPSTGSMNVLAIALIAMMSLTAVVVTAKKSDEE